MLANSIHPGLPQMPPFGRHRVGLGELARLITWAGADDLIKNTKLFYQFFQARNYILDVILQSLLGNFYKF